MTRRGRGWIWSSSATASARADPASPATRRQTSPPANLFARSWNACQFLNISTAYGTTGGERPRGVTRPSEEARRLPRPLREIKRQRLQLDREIDVLQAHLARHLEACRREIQDRADAGGDEPVADVLGGLAGYGDDGDLDAARLHLARHVAAVDDGHGVHLARDLGGIVVDDGRDAKALAAEALVMEERGTEIAEADEHDGPLAIEPENPLQLGLEAGDVIADAAHAELPEISEVLAHLRGVQIEPVRHLLRGDGLDAVLLQLEQAPRVDGETMDRHLRDPRRAVRGPSWHVRKRPGAVGTDARPNRPTRVASREV